jgi:MFS family permease
MVLAACLALGMMASTIVMTTSALIGYSLAEDKELATLPLALQFTATMLTTIPASLLMRRIGRRAGLTIGALIGVCGALLAAHSIVAADFQLFAIASLPLGICNSFTHYYRFTAADTASEAFRPRAISLVMAGGVVSALLGPELAKASIDLLAPVLYAGCYLAIAGLLTLSALLLQAVRIPRLTAAQRADSGRPLGQILGQRSVVVAILSAAIGYAVMNLVMTSTPLAMTACGFAFGDAAFVIQWHALAMFAPSFVTGRLIGRFGAPRIILAGALLTGGAVATNLSSVALPAFWAGLVLLGLGWNFLYVGGAALLTAMHAPAERGKVQAANDFLVFAAVTASAFSSGYLHSHWGWPAVNLAVVPLVILVGLVAVGTVLSAPRTRPQSV